MGLPEVMISAGILSIVACGIVQGIITSRRIAENNLAHSYAAATAQSIIEQVSRIPAEELLDADATGIQVIVPVLTSQNTTSMRRMTLPWASDPSSYIPIGDPDDPDAGLLVDAAYIAEEQRIRPERHMPFRINLQREIHEADSRVALVLRYQWAQPTRRTENGSQVFLNGVLTTMRSTMVSF